MRPHLLRFGRKQGVRPQNQQHDRDDGKLIARIRIMRAEFLPGDDLAGRVPKGKNESI
jgi:hypothetical protein